MDLERTVAQHDEQIGQILAIISVTVDRQQRLDNALVDLAEAQKDLARVQKELAEIQKSTAESVRELAASQQELRDSLAASQKETDGRIQKLVSAIGQILPRPNAN